MSGSIAVSSKLQGLSVELDKELLISHIALQKQWFQWSFRVSGDTKAKDTEDIFTRSEYLLF